MWAAPPRGIPRITLGAKATKARDIRFTTRLMRARWTPTTSATIRKKHPFAAHNRKLHNCNRAGKNGPLGSGIISGIMPATANTVSFLSWYRRRNASSPYASKGFCLLAITRGTTTLFVAADGDGNAPRQPYLSQLWGSTQILLLNSELS